MTPNRFPEGWNEERVRRVLEHHDAQSPEEAVAEDEAAFEDATQATMAIPTDWVPTVQSLIAKRKAS